MYIDIFLKEYGKTRYEVSKKTGISEQVLSKANNRNPETYSIKIVESLAKAVGILPEQALRKLIDIKNEKKLYVATNAKEVQQALNANAAQFIVKGSMNALAKDIKKSDVSEDAKFIVDAGTYGGATFVSWIMLILSNMFKKEDDKLLNNIRFKIFTFYNIEPIDSYSAKLTAKDFIKSGEKE